MELQTKDVIKDGIFTKLGEEDYEICNLNEIFISNKWSDL